jgi:hypothetical protein
LPEGSNVPPQTALPPANAPADRPAQSAGDSPAAPSAPQAQAPSAQPPTRPARPAAEPARSGPDGAEREGIPLLVIGLAVLGLAVVGLIIFLVTRRLQGNPNRVMAQAASPRAAMNNDLPPFKDHSKDLANYAASHPKKRITPYSDHKPTMFSAAQSAEFSGGPLLLNLFVEDQNTLIGKRNIHALKSGYSFTIGGGKSDFLIFLVPMPPALGEVRREGNRCTFIPRKARYFPDIGSTQVPDCIGKTIRVVSDKNYEIRFRLERYEDPLIALNRMLNSIKVPG